MKRKILNSFIICTIGISLSACNKKEVKNESLFSSYGTGAYYFQRQLDLYKNLGIYKGYQFNIHLKGKLRP